SAGCTVFLTSSGKDLGTLETRDQVRREFGQPTATGISEGHPYEDFLSYRKIAEPEKGTYLVMGDIATLGLGELVWFPTELYRVSCRSIRGQTIRFTYDESGNVTGARLDGQPVLLGTRTDLTPAGQRPGDIAGTDHTHKSE